MKKNIYVKLFIFLILFCIWLFAEIIIFGDAIFEKNKIKSFFVHDQNVQKVVKMVSQKDFSACFDVYCILKNGEKYVFVNVRIENEKICFYKFFKTDSQLKWIEEIKTDSNIVAEQLEKFRN